MDKNDKDSLGIEYVKMNHVAMTPQGNKIGLTKSFIQKGRPSVNVKDANTLRNINRFIWAQHGTGYLSRYSGARYIINEVDKEETDVNYIITFPRYPGLTGGGDTIKEAKKMAKEALEMYLEARRTDKREVLSDGGKK